MEDHEGSPETRQESSDIDEQQKTELPRAASSHEEGLDGTIPVCAEPPEESRLERLASIPPRFQRGWKPSETIGDSNHRESIDRQREVEESPSLFEICPARALSDYSGSEPNSRTRSSLASSIRHYSPGWHTRRSSRNRSTSRSSTARHWSSGWTSNSSTTADRVSSKGWTPKTSVQYVSFSTSRRYFLLLQSGV